MLIKPYGDTLNDGAVQLSFSLPVKNGGRAREAARLLVLKLGFKSCDIAHSAPLSEDFTFFVAYAKTDSALDYSKVEYQEAVSDNCMNMDQVNDFIKAKFKRKLVVVGACTGTDAHTVGIDAIMNMKGYNHHFGLERYPMIEAYNLGAQVPNEALIDFARNKKADAILVSQVVTQKEVHVKNLTEFVELLEAEKLRSQFVVVIGGPRVSNKLALEMGFDAGFGAGTYAEHVATFIVHKLLERRA
ncbi:MAG TPA: OAM dimerization domain-containing protein [Elusimicrobiales bacterium]|nr:OAM dimerization domain-containing protein [Elusimicrobiales bacterium]